MMKTVFAAIAVALALGIAAGGAVADDRDGRRGKGNGSHGLFPGEAGWSIKCAGGRLVVEATDDNGAPVRARLGGLTAERADDTVTVRKGDEVLMSFEVSAYQPAPPGILEAIQSVKTLQELCALDRKDYGSFSALGAATLYPGLASTGVLGGLVYKNGEPGVLILVLFILLVIIGAGFGLG